MTESDQSTGQEPNEESANQEPAEEPTTKDADQESAEEPTTDDLKEPSTEKEPGEEPKAPPRAEPDPSHEAVGIGIIGRPQVEPEAEGHSEP